MSDKRQTNVVCYIELYRGFHYIRHIRTYQNSQQVDEQLSSITISDGEHNQIYKLPIVETRMIPNKVVLTVNHPGKKKLRL